MITKAKRRPDLSNRSVTVYDCGDGFWVDVFRGMSGCGYTCTAMRLDEPGGYVTPRGMKQNFSYLRDAVAWCERKKTEAA